MKTLITNLLLSAVILIPFSTNLFAQCEPAPGTGPLACQEAPIFCSILELDGYSCTTSNSGVGLCPALFCGSCENYQFFAFTAGFGDIELEINVSNCNGTGMGSGLQAEIFQTDDCVNFISHSNCVSPGSQGPLNLTAQFLTPGETYYLLIDGWAGDICDYEINVIEDGIPYSDTSGGISGPEFACLQTTGSYSISYPLGVAPNSISWTLSNDNGLITAGEDSTVVNVEWFEIGATELCAAFINNCGENDTLCNAITIDSVLFNDLGHVLSCSFEPFIFGGATITESGIYIDSFLSVQGCDSVVQVSVDVFPPVSTFFMSTICEGDTFSLGNQTITQAGSYIDTLQTFQGCDSIVHLDLTISSPIISSSEIINDDGSGNGLIDIIGVSNGIPPYNFEWSNGQIGPLITELFMGDYEVTVTDAVGCTVVQTFTVTLIIGTSETSISNSIQLFPNPLTSGSILTVEWPKSLGALSNLKIHDLNGRMIFQQSTKTDAGQYQTHLELPPGIYMLDCWIENFHWTEKLVVLE